MARYKNIYRIESARVQWWDYGAGAGSDKGTPNETFEPRSKNTSRPSTFGQKRFQNTLQSTVSSIIGSFKSAVTLNANQLGLKNGWPSRFHDRIIRSEAGYQRISNYIIRNPVIWKNDYFYRHNSRK